MLQIANNLHFISGKCTVRYGKALFFENYKSTYFCTGKSTMFLAKNLFLIFMKLFLLGYVYYKKQTVSQIMLL